jgi:large subunit ribosomal protein L32
MLPVKKTSKSRTRTRRSHHALSAPNYYACPKCGSAKLTHTACGKCGFYNDSIVIEKK